MPERPIPIRLAPKGAKLTPRQWAQIESFLDQWKRDVLAAARRYPARSYRLGVAQIEAFADLLANLPAAVPDAAMFGGVGPSMREAEGWARRYLLHELDDALNVFIGKIKDELLYGLRSAENPTVVASRLYKAIGDATINWRAIARTEMVRANAAGRLKACQDMGFDRVWAPPHIGACPACKRILEGNVFRIADVIHATNYGKAEREWVPCIPLHPHCRHAWLPYDPDIHAEAMGHYAAMEAAGLTDEDRLDEMFDSSGQLRPEYADVDFSAAKTLDPYGEVLAAVVWKVKGPERPDFRYGSERLRLADVRSDLYQRAVDPMKVLKMHASLRAGRDLPPAKVARRPDGTVWVIDGQHRVEARKLAGEHDAEFLVRESMGWPDEADECRALIGKVLAPAHAHDLLALDEDVTKTADTLEDALQALVSEQPAQPDLQLDPALWDGLRLRDDVAERLRAAWEHIGGKGSLGEYGPDETWTGWARLYVPADGGPARVLVDYNRLRQARPEWRELADTDLHLALVLAARNALEGTGIDVRIEPDQRDQNGLWTDAHLHGPMWGLREQTWLGGVPDGTEKSLAERYPNYRWVEKATVQLPAVVAWHVAPAGAREAIREHGLIEAQPNDRWRRYGAAAEPAGVYVWVDRKRALKWANDLARLVGHSKLAQNDVWRVNIAGLEQRIDPVLSDQGAIYLPVPGIAPNRLELEVTKTNAELEVDVAKAGQPAANVGVEHWITVHPHGPDEPGQPVLVRNNSDGTMSVIGGAGGNLNMLRLDPSRRVDDPSKAKGAKQIEQHVTAAEARESEQQREAEVNAAREQLSKLDEVRKQRTQELHGYITDQLGLELPEDHRQRRKMLAKIRQSALRTLAYGEVRARATQESASQDELGLGGEDAPKPLEPDADQDGAPDAVDADDEHNDAVERKPRPQIAQTAEQARAILDHFLDLQQLRRAASGHRKVINGEAQASDANQIDWTVGADEKAKRRASLAEQQIRTDLSRSLLEHGDRQFRGKGNYDRHYKQAFVQGGYDTLDAFSHSILGASPLTKEGQRLLGVAGSAQLAAWHLQQEAAKQGKEGFDLEKVQKALKDLTDEQESKVNDLGLARVQTAMNRAAQAQAELAKSELGESLYTATMARSIAAEKTQEAKRQLGMMIGGLEACSALKVALDRRADEKIKVGGFTSPATIKDLARKAGLTVHDTDIKKVGAGNYTLALAPERLEGMLREPPKVDQAYRDRLQQIRTGQDLDEAIEQARTGPGMSDVLDANQARGKMFLQAAGSGVLGFDPGVGKTHTAIAAAMERMHANPGQKALIVAPTNMLRSWGDTIRSQGSGHSVQIVGQSDTNPDKDTGDTKKKIGQLTRGADFTVISYESLRSYQQHLKAMGEHTPSIVIADELQKAKNEGTGLHKGVEGAVDASLAQHGAGNVNFWGLTGTPIEKDVGDVHAMVKLAAKAKGAPLEDRKTFTGRYGAKQGKGFAQAEHIARGDKIRQFRKSVMDEHLFRLTAQDAGNQLPDPAREHHPVELDEQHKADFQQRVNGLNQQWSDYLARRKEDPTIPAPFSFGGRDALMDALYNREGSALIKGVADEIEKSGTFTHKGGSYRLADGNADPDDHAGTYEHKHVVFGASETSRALFGPGWNKPGATPGGLHGELERRGIKVFVGHGSMSSAQNEANYKAFLAHPGKAVFLTNDKNNAGISLQFGDNKGAFQHGATHMHHFTRPVNNATIQQREARTLRKGAQAKVTYHTYSAGTPIEQRLDETLDRELRTQDLAANSEQQVAGSDTLAHHLEQRGIKRRRKAADARSR